MKYIIQQIYVYADDSVVRVSVQTFTDLSIAEKCCNEKNEHNIKFHGDSKDCSFYRVLWQKEVE